MTALALTEGSSRALALKEEELIPVLQASLYPGAKPESIKLVLGYCKAAGLDPMQKPVHLVPMSVKKPGGGRDEYEWRDVVMPGIGLYRVQAARTGQLAGIDEPVFGPEVEKFGIKFPEWCKVTVYRMIGGQRVAFTALEFWEENYATQKRDSDAPNAMWKRRPRGQLAKCTEAQGLRKAFPELGAQPTADETTVDVEDVIDIPPSPAPAPTVGRKPKAAPKPPADVIDVEPTEAAPAPIQTPTPTPTRAAGAASDGGTVGAGEIAYLEKKAKSINKTLAAVADEIGMHGLVIEAGKLSKDDFAAIKQELMRQAS